MLVALIPPIFGTLGIVFGLGRLVPDPTPDADNIYRFLSGLYVTMGALFLWVVPDVERQTGLVRILAAGVVLGAIGRVASMVQVGTPRLLFQVDVLVETLVPLVVVLWQHRVARLARLAPSGPGPDGPLRSTSGASAP